MRLGFCARYILYPIRCVRFQVGIVPVQFLNGNVFELNFAFDDGRQKFSLDFKTVSTNPLVFICRFPMWMNPRRAKGARGKKAFASTKKCVCFVSDSKVN